jgi:tRNA threonylcarbamoyladenosine biosynthesis protein TsaB
LLVLGIETATRVATVGLVRAPLATADVGRVAPGPVADGCTALAVVARDTGLAHGAELLSLIDECLAAAGARLEDVRCIAVGIGPGSFTGLRVALATAKGLALGGGVTLVGVSTLEALAATVLPGWCGAEPPPDGVAPGTLVASCLDARKGEVYGAAFAVREPVAEAASPRLERLARDAALRPADFARLLGGLLDERPGGSGPALLLGDGPERYADAIATPLAVRVRPRAAAPHHPHGVAVARLGAGELAASGGHDAASLVPRYARASEAEIARTRSAGETSR